VSGEIVNRDIRRRAPESYRSSRPPDLFLNFLPLTLLGDTFVGDVLPFDSAEQLAHLRSQHASTHVFRRHREQIAAIPIAPDAPAIGELTTFDLRQSSALVAHLAQEALIRYLVTWDYRLAGFNPPSFVVRQPQRDLLAWAVGDSAQAVPWLHVYPRYTLDCRIVHGRGGPQLGVLVGVRTRREIDSTAADLIDMGMDMRGCYVLTDDGALLRDLRRDPITRRRTEGRVQAIVGNQLILSDAPRLSELRADNAWPEARLETFAAAVRVSGVPDPEGVLYRLDQAVFDLVGAKGRYQRLIEIGEWLKHRGPLVLANGLTCLIEVPTGLRSGSNGGEYRRFRSPTFVFDPASTKTAWSQDRGLEDFGPFDAEVFTPKRPHIAVVTPKSFQGDVEVFMRKFKQGVPNAKTFAQGFVRKYRLSDCSFHVESFEPGPREGVAYREACLRALAETPKPHLAFVIVKEEHKNLPPNEDPYLIAKSTFMSQGVPVQEVLIETIRVTPQEERGVPYTLSGISLASYAKLGGIPFVVSAAQSLIHELVIGIGSATLRDDRFGVDERVVGITTVFSADGNYLLYSTSREVPFDEYPNELLTSLRTAVEQIKVRNAWQQGDDVRLIFHVFKPLKDLEARAVKQLVEGLVDFRVEFAFLHVSEKHDWILFDRKSEGIRDWQIADPNQRGLQKGEYVPERGYAVPLGRFEILLTTIGPRGLMTSIQGAPRPLLLKLHRESTFEDLEYLAAQAYRFTSMSWRSLFPSNRPVTILYSDLIASLLGRLRHVRNWNPDALTTTLRTSRWFL
jgi:hypothetical protein